MLEQMDPVDTIRLAVFLLLLIFLLFIEKLLPRRKSEKKAMRWFSNLTISFINTGTLALLSLSAVAASLYAQQNLYGLFYYWHIPLWPQIFITIIALDFAVYWQHRLCHSNGTFWLIHRMHHTDNMVDVTTALRFHPFEIVVSMLIKCLVIILLGSPLLGVILFEIILNSAAMFNHSNFKLPEKLDKYLRCFIVTPDMHRVHHSQNFKERNHNYGFFLSIWDRLFKTYKAQPDAGHKNMLIGMKTYQGKKQNYLPIMLLHPFYGNQYKKNKLKKNKEN